MNAISGDLSRSMRVLLRCAPLAVAVALTACSRPAEPAVEAPGPGSAVGIADDNAASIWIASRNHDAYLSTTAGHTWNRVPGTWGVTALAFVPDGTLLAHARQLVFAPSNGVQPALRLVAAPAPLRQLATPYPLTGRLYGLDTHDRLWVSVRAGKRWQPVRALGFPRHARAVAAVRGDPTMPDTIYVGAPRGVWVSTDFGESFRRILDAPPAVWALATTTDAPLRLLVGGRNGIYLSQDGGASFRRVSRTPVLALAYDWRNWQNAVALTRDGDLLRSADGGATW